MIGDYMSTSFVGGVAFPAFEVAAQPSTGNDCAAAPLTVRRLAVHDRRRFGAVTLSGRRVEAYLARLGVDAPPTVDAEGLRALQRAHLRRIPFENLDIHIGVPIVLDIDRIVDKLTVGHRGGYCTS